MKQLYVIDLWVDKNKKYSYLSNTLITKIEQSIKENKKIILYINKRWAYDMSICQDCNYIDKCSNCDLALSIHKNPNRLICHHCSYIQDIWLSCKKCFWTNLKNVWVWTQQIEENIIQIFPWINIFRLDSDSVKNITQKKTALENISKSQIIIWTKMITTWFDFKDIWIIWVILLEQELQIPKYDTEEKIYSNIKQLIWRWWRLWQNTDIILQTLVPNNEFVKSIINLNYKDFFIKTLHERKLFNYPPYCELATIRYKDKQKEKSESFINWFYEKLLSHNTWSYEIIKFWFTTKRDNQYFSKIIIKWNWIRDFLQPFKKEIFSNKDLVVIFE